MQGRVINKNADQFNVLFGKQVYLCKARKNLKSQGVFVGDKVSFCKNELVLNEVLPRKNLLVRPPIANLDKMIIVISKIPQPDFYLVDKLILFSFAVGIKPVLCVNKSDIDPNFFEEVKKIYSKVLKVIKCSAKQADTLSVEKEISGVCCFAGQSAVGKSSIINSMFKQNLEKVGSLAKKVERGKQTTRQVTIYPFKKGYIADTAGFSKLDESLIPLKSTEIDRFYPDFIDYIGACRFRSCKHTHKEGCNVFKAAYEGKISKSRYENYLKIFNVKDKRMGKV